MSSVNQYSWRVKATMNLNIESLWYPRFNSGYLFFGPQEYYQFSDEATQVINLEDRHKNVVYGKRYGNKTIGRDFSHYGVKLTEPPKQSAPIIVIAGYELDRGNANEGYDVKITSDIVINSPDDMTIDEYQKADAWVTAHIDPAEIRSPIGVVFGANYAYTIAETDLTNKYAICRIRTSAADAPIDGFMKSKLEAMKVSAPRYIQDLSQLFLNHNYGVPDFGPFEQLLKIDFNFYVAGGRIDAIAVEEDTLAVAIYVDGEKRIYYYSIQDLTDTHATLEKDSDNYIAISAEHTDSKVYGMCLSGGTIFLVNRAEPNILVIDLNTGQVINRVVLSIDGGSVFNFFEKIRGITIFGDFYFIIAKVEGIVGHSGWQIVQTDIDGDVVSMTPYPWPPASGSVDEDRQIFLSLAGERLVMLAFNVGYKLVYYKIDTSQSPVLIPVCAKQTWSQWFDRSGISRVAEFERNQFHLYPLEYDNAVIESIEVTKTTVDAFGATSDETIEILRIETYHDETKYIENIGDMKGPFYLLDPNDSIAGSQEWQDDFDWYYCWFFDTAFVDEALTARAGGAGISYSIDPIYANLVQSWVGATETLRADLRVSPIALAGNHVYLETPESVTNIKIRYLVKRSFSTYSVNTMAARQVDPDAGLLLNTFVVIAERRFCKVYYERSIDPYYHLAPEAMVDPGADVIKLISFSPSLTVENSGFVFVDHTDREIETIDVSVTPKDIVASGPSISSDNIIYWYAIARDKYGVAVPNRPLTVRAVGFVQTQGDPVEADLASVITFSGSNLTDFMGKISGTLTVTGYDALGRVALRSLPFIVRVSYDKRGGLSAQRDETVYGHDEIWIQG
ncbi:MAG: hypothetical protein A2Y38_07550 [Spirochaetes bacterium GWB1_59_5]|nr:MAG: hypothetical protein A2Y38_07550 [Spirochaetes bacterium GWB1_59_5]